MALTTQEALGEWLELLQDFSAHWGTLMEEAWKDLPPHIADELLKATRIFADARDLLKGEVASSSDD